MDPESVVNVVITNSSNENVVKKTVSETKKLRIGIAAIGSRGDVQPYIALGVYLQERGHIITIATENRMKPLVEEYNLKFSCIYGDMVGILFQPELQKPLQDGSLFQIMKLSKDWEKQWNKIDIYNSYLNALEGSEVVISSGLCLTPAYCVAEKFNALYIPMILGPTIMTSEFPIWLMESIIPCSCLNKWSYKVLFSLLWDAEKKLVNQWRQEIGLPIIQNKRGLSELIENNPTIVAYSPLLCPRQRAPLDYPRNVLFDGFLFVPTDINTMIDSKLKEYLTLPDSRPVIYLGFGSMPAPNPEALIKMSLDICKLCDCRAVLVAGWSQLSGEGKEEGNSNNHNNDSSSSNDKRESELRKAIRDGTMFTTKSVNHEWLLPQMKCIVHHGGVGTVAASLRAGSPQVICPFMLDQPHNAKTVMKLGCSPGYVKYDSYINAIKVSKLIQKVLTSSQSNNISHSSSIPLENIYIKRAREVGDLIREESNAAHQKYCEMIEKCALEKNFK